MKKYIQTQFKLVDNISDEMLKYCCFCNQKHEIVKHYRIKNNLSILASIYVCSNPICQLHFQKFLHAYFVLHLDYHNSMNLASVLIITEKEKIDLFNTLGNLRTIPYSTRKPNK